MREAMKVMRRRSVSKGVAPFLVLSASEGRVRRGMVLLLIGLFLCSLLGEAVGFNFDEDVKLRSPKVNPYSYDPTKSRRPASRVDRAERRPLVSVAPGTPAVVTDSDGNKLYYFKGELRLKVDLEGNQTFFSNNMAAYEKDDEGGLRRLFKSVGNGLRASFNERNELLGYNQYGLGKKLLKEYDKDKNPTRTYEYGSNLKWIIDELSGVRTEYNRYGKPMQDIDFEGNTLAYYEYRDGWRMSRRVERTLDEKGNVVDGDATIYDELGRMPLYKLSHLGNKFSIFSYAPENKYRLLSITDMGEEGDRTLRYDQKGRTIEEVDFLGNVLRSYTWEGTRLISSLDHETNELTWYDVQRSPMATTYKGDFVHIWIKDKGRLLGEYEVEDESLTVKYYNRELGKVGVKLERLPRVEGELSIERVEEAVGNWIERKDIVASEEISVVELLLNLQEVLR